jgi:hypothetical protein
MALSFVQFIAKIPTLHGTKRWAKLTRWETYYDGKQYDCREYDENGMMGGMVGYYGLDGYVPWSERRVRAVHNVAADIVNELAEWSVVGNAWCSITIDEDPDAQAWLEGLIDASNMPHAVGECAKIQGGCGTGVVSAMFKDGCVRLENHRPKLVWVTRWADQKDKVPAEVFKVYCPVDDFEAEDETKKKEEYRVRYWSNADGQSKAPGVPAERGVEAYYRFYKNDRGEWLVSLINYVVHGCERCPVFWVPNTVPSEEDGNDGLADFAGQEGKIDDMNELFQASSNTSKRNADDTLSVKHDGTTSPGTIKKGAGVAIVSTGGAEYLSQNGDSARIMNEHGTLRENQIYRSCSTVKADTQDLAKQTSGEALKRLYYKQTNKCDDKRHMIEHMLIRPLCKWMLVESRKLPVGSLVMSLIIIEDVDGKMIGSKARVPGKSENVKVEWPDSFPPTLDDFNTASNAVKNVTGGARVLSNETAIRALVKAGAPVSNVLAEVTRVRKDAEEKAEQEATAMGMATAERAKAEKENAGPVDSLELPSVPCDTPCSF